MSFTRLYVEPTKTLMVQGRKRIIVNHGQSCQSCSPDIVLLNWHSPLPLINWRVPD